MKAIGVDLGGTKLNIGIVDNDGNFEIEERSLTLSNWPEMRETIVNACKSLIEKHGDIKAVGIGAAGMISLDGHVVYSPNVPAFNVENHIDIKGELEKEIGLPVVVDNDNNCSGYCEYRFGAAKGMKNVLNVGLGTGIGGALILDGKIYRGNDGYAFDIGHFIMDINGEVCACGQIGCFETLGSGTTLGRIARKHVEAGEDPELLDYVDGDISKIQGTHVYAALKDNPDSCKNIMQEFGDNIGLGIASLENILNFGVCVISGGVSEIGEPLIELVRAKYKLHAQGSDRRELPQILLAKYTSNAGVLGAGALALDSLG